MPPHCGQIKWILFPQTTQALAPPLRLNELGENMESNCSHHFFDGFEFHTCQTVLWMCRLFDVVICLLARCAGRSITIF